MKTSTATVLIILAMVILVATRRSLESAWDTLRHALIRRWKTWKEQASAERKRDFFALAVCFLLATLFTLYQLYQINGNGYNSIGYDAKERLPYAIGAQVVFGILAASVWATKDPIPQERKPLTPIPTVVPPTAAPLRPRTKMDRILASTFVQFLLLATVPSLIAYVVYLIMYR